MKVAAVSLLVLALATTGRAQQRITVAPDEATLASLIPLFIACDLKAEFITPSIDERVLLWLGTPVSRDGARIWEESRMWTVTQVPLVLESGPSQRRGESALIAPIDEPHTGGQRHVLVSGKHLHSSAKAVVPARTESSTWVRVRALYGP